MIGSLRLKLSAFYTAVTGVILIAMTALCLLVSEQDIRAKTNQNFDGFLSTVSSYLSSQRAVSADWLREVETAGDVTISIFDRGMPLYSMRHAEAEVEAQIQQVRQRAMKDYQLSAKEACHGRSCSFLLEDAGGNACIGGYGVIAKEDSVIELVLLHSLADMERQIWRQRLVVCLGEVLALALLWLFSWHFTGTLLRPIQENQRRQAQFTAAASHELRTPLAVMLSAASAMERSEEEQRRIFSRQIQSEGQRMSRLIGDMLLLSSADSQSWQLQKAPTEPDMLLLEVYERYLPLAREKGLTLAICIPEEDISLVSLDRERISQVLSILLDNALAYTPAPGGIMLTLEHRRNRVAFLVADTGPGVPDSQKEAIFQRFHRGEAARSDRGHFGLGLSIAAQLVKLHRGRLWVRDAATGGAEFVVELPLPTALPFGEGGTPKA